MANDQKKTYSKSRTPGNPGIVTQQILSPGQQNRAKSMRRNMTPAEKLLWRQLRADRLSGWHFRRQQIIGRYIVDFFCHKAGLVVEVDGSSHSYQVEYDHERDEYLKTRNLQVLRFTNTEVEKNIEAVLTVIDEQCRQSIENIREE